MYNHISHHYDLSNCDDAVMLLASSGFSVMLLIFASGFSLLDNEGRSELPNALFALPSCTALNL
jgi:hypothetical protein